MNPGIQTRQTQLTAMKPTLENLKAAAKVAKSRRATVPLETQRAQTKVPTRPPGKIGKREAEKEKEKLTSVLKQMMTQRPPQWPKEAHGTSRQTTYTKNTGARTVPTAGTPRTE